MHKGDPRPTSTLRLAAAPSHPGGNRLSKRLCFSLVADFMRNMEIELLSVKSVRFLADYPWRPGKRLRPLTFILAYLTARLARSSQPVQPGSREVKLAAAIELLHEASLVHDDLVDRSLLRRGVPTMQVVNGEGLALLIGDYMIFRGLKFILDAAHTRAEIELAQDLADTGLQIAHGQVDQLDRFLSERSLAARMSLEGYMDVIARKTAAFFAGCAEAGGALGGAEQKERALFRDFGTEMGVAFQILDDVLDVSGDPGLALKSVRNDLNEGTVTLPMIHARALFPRDPAWKQFDRQHTKQLSTVAERRLYELFAHGDVIAGCLETAEKHLARARCKLGELPNNIYRLGLADLLEYVQDSPWSGVHAPRKGVESNDKSLRSKKPRGSQGATASREGRAHPAVSGGRRSHRARQLAG